MYACNRWKMLCNDLARHAAFSAGKAKSPHGGQWIGSLRERLGWFEATLMD